MTPLPEVEPEHQSHAEYWERRRRESITLDGATVGALKWASSILAAVLVACLIGGATALLTLSRDVSVAIDQVGELKKWREQVDMRLTSGGFSAKDGEALKAWVATVDQANRDRDAATIRQIETLTTVIERLAQRLDAHTATAGHSISMEKVTALQARVEALEKRVQK